MRAVRRGVSACAIAAVLVWGCGKDGAGPSTGGQSVTITVSPLTAGVQVGATTQLTAIVSGTSNVAVSWQSSSTQIATVSPTGVVTGVAVGMATIVGTSSADPTKQASAVVTVTAPTPVLTGISISPPSISVPPGGTAQFTVIGTYSSGPSQVLTTVATFSATGGTITSGGLYTAGTTAGTFSVQASFGGFNATASVTIAPVQNLPDLVVTALTGPSSGTIGSSITVAVTVQNQGTAQAAAFRVALYYSTDPNITTSDISAGVACNAGSGLPTGLSATCNGAIPVPGTLAPGTYYLGAIADDQNQIVESNEGNNARASTAIALTGQAAPPDLVPTEFTGPAAGVIGDSVQVGVTVANQGTGDAGAFRALVVLSTDATLTTTDTPLAACTYQNGLLANSSGACTGRISVPSTVAAGSYFLGVIVDDQNFITESNETNNTRSAPITLTSVGTGPDLVVTALTAPGTATVGGTIQVSMTVENQGNAVASAFRVGFYLSTDATITTSDIFTGVECTYATGLAANTNNTCAGPHNIPGNIAAGTYYLGAIADDQSSVQELNESNNTRASAQITITGGQGQNLEISSAYINQSVQADDRSVPLIENRAGAVIVNVRASLAGAPAIGVRVRIFNGTTEVSTQTGTTTPSLNPTCCGVVVPIAANLVTANVGIVVEIDTNNQVTETNEADNRFPAAGTQAFTVRAMNPFNITIVPVFQSVNGRTGSYNPVFLNDTRVTWPIATLTEGVHATYTSNSPALAATDDQTWRAVLQEIEALRVAEGSQRYYHGIVNVSYTSGIVGLAFLPGRAGLSVDFNQAAANTIAHELGHNFGRLHSPCGNVASSDPNYPFSDGRSGAFGYNYLTGAVQQPTQPDIMGYCNNSWVSIYNYRGAMDYRSANANARVLPPQSTVLVWGGVDAERIALQPAFFVETVPTEPNPAGRYRAEGFDAQGQRLFSIPFEPQQVSDVATAQSFALAIPVSSDVQSRVATIEIAGPAQRAALRSVIRMAGDLFTLGAQAELAATAEAGGATVRWNADRYTMAMIRDAVTGQVLSFATGGSALVRLAGRELDVTLSDGVASATQRVIVR